ncbi:MAG: hypothetical protein JJE22_18855, partial [Bacteroidia bacterium]|nr:hypothetical protein [Bacteroidia bacterium]
DYFFFLHSFLWAFAPWSIIAYFAVAGRLKNLLQRKEEWLTTGVFIIILLVVSFSGFKLPHYLNIVFPTSAVLTAAFILHKKNTGKWIRAILIIQGSVVFLLLILVAIINAWAFPVRNTWVIIGMILLLSVVFYFIKSKMYSSLQKSVFVSVAAMVFSFFLLNSNFYPQLLKYQGGNELAFATRGKVDPNNVYFWNNTYSSSFNFYTATLRKPFTDLVLQQGKVVWLMFDIRDEEQIKQAGYHLNEQFSALDYEITKLDIKFINPARRDSACTKLLLAEISK